jgi:hypothetical protein
MSEDNEYGLVARAYDGAWAIRWIGDDGEFTAATGDAYDTKEEAEAAIPEWIKSHEHNMAEMEAEELVLYKEFPNLAYVDARINKIKDPSQRLDAALKLSWLRDIDLTEHISWPLPSWKIIKGGNSEAIKRAMHKLSSS